MTSRMFADAAVQKYLADRDIAILATVGPDSSPLAMPMWFIHDPTTLAMVSVDNLQDVRHRLLSNAVCRSAIAPGTAAAVGKVLRAGPALAKL